MLCEVIAIVLVICINIVQKPEPVIIYRVIYLKKILKIKILTDNIREYIREKKIFQYIDVYATKSLIQSIQAHHISKSVSL